MKIRWVIIILALCNFSMRAHGCTEVSLSMFDGGNEVMNGTAYHILNSQGNEVAGGVSTSVDEWFHLFCVEEGCYTLIIEPNGPGNPITWFIDGPCI
ncbi:MAG: hypothetical protein JNM00_16345, partial [Flavobacteriales bacterium]|nr:hypothetical protein [Flavobacteriales bacterium]